ncbi:MAG: cyclic nucleotide-binding domain-containing protein [Alphaproteobacteria bacterium]|nr:cyclic nucleotide-binding domain-containing protein [Alphaproteobacteria bacterium]
MLSPVILAVFGFAVLLALVSLLVPIARRISLPFTVLLAVVGSVLGFAALEGGTQDYLVLSLKEMRIPAEGFVYVFLPPLLFAGGLTVDVRRLMDDVTPVLVLAIVAVLVCMATVGIALHLATGVELILCLMLGSIVAPTDTAAVLGIFRDIGVPSRLQVIVEGESLFNDAAAVALFVVILGVLTNQSEASFLDGAIEFGWGFAGGMILGWIAAQVTGWLISQFRGAQVTEITLTVAMTYLTFVIGQAFIGVSGIIAVVMAAIVFASDGRTRLSPGTWDTLLTTWRQLEFWATSLIFVLAAMLTPRMIGQLQWSDLLGVAVIFVAALGARASVLWGVLPALTYFGLSQPISNEYKAVLAWGSLRGAVTAALALTVVETPGVSQDQGRLIFVWAVGFVLATLFIAAPTLRPLMKALKLDKLTPEERLVRDRVMALSRGRVRESMSQIAKMLGLATSAPIHQAAETSNQVQGVLSRDDLVRAGLIVLANRETELSLEYLQRGLVGRRIAERMRADAGRVLDAVRQGGASEYLAAALGNQKPSWRFRLALWVQRRFRWSTLLAEEIADRFELLLIKQLTLRELLEFADAKVADLIGHHAALTAKEALEGRMQAISGAIEGLDLQYPDYTNAMRTRYLERLSIGLEEAEYRGQRDQSLISDEVYEDLEEDRHRRRGVAEKRPPLDLGLKLTEMLEKVPIFAGIKGKDIARLAQMLTPELFLPGERIIRAGDKGDRMYFIASGVVDVLVAPNPVRLKSGDFFGEMALLTDNPRNADVVSAGYTNMLELRRRDFETLLRANPDMKQNIERVAQAREAQNISAAAVSGE